MSDDAFDRISKVLRDRTLHLPMPDDSRLILAWCPAGRFERDGQERLPLPSVEGQQTVMLTHGFWIGTTVITQGQWQMVMGEPPKMAQDGDNLPAEMTWDAAHDFCNTLTAYLHTNQHLKPNQRLTLPTEAQWEYACRAGSRTRWYFGDDAADLGSHAWFADNADGTKHQVAHKQPNTWGLYDIYGNVMEWCLDDLTPYGLLPSLNGVCVDPAPVVEGGRNKVVRGGCYHFQAERCRSGYRGNAYWDDPYNDPIGLRVVCIEG